MPLDDAILKMFLNSKRVAEIRDELLQSSDSDAHLLGLFISDQYPFPAAERQTTGISIAAAAAPEPEEVLDKAVRMVTKGGDTIPEVALRVTFEKAKNWGLALLQELFFNLRKKICGAGKEPTPIGHNTTAALAALGAIVCAKLGLSPILGNGLSVLLVLDTARIGKSTLCKMTSPEELTRYFS